jgi:hypothetical protein
MVFRTWSVDTYVTSFETEELPDDHFEDNEKPFPEFPPWRPPDHQSYYSDEEEAPHPEIDSRVLPIWVPWWPIPHLDYFNDLPEIITPDKYESPHEVPVWPILWPHFLWKEKQEIPAPGVEYVPPMYVPPPPKPYFMPPEIPFHIDIPNPTALCPPPCLRRPDRKC